MDNLGKMFSAAAQNLGQTLSSPSALGSIIGGLFTSSTNRRNREFAAAQARQQNQWNIEQWQRENEYNSPAAQMKRYIDAGLNPNLALGMQNLSASSPQLVSGKDAPAGVSPIDALTGAQIANLDSLTKKNLKDVQKSDSEIVKLIAEAGLIGWTAEQVKTEISLNETLVEKNKTEMELVKSDIKYQDLQNKFLEDTFDDRVNQIAAESHISQEKAKSIVQVIDATIRELNSRTAANNASAHLSYAQARVQQALVTYYKALEDKAGAERAYVDLQKELLDAYGDDLNASEIVKNLSYTESSSVSESTSSSISTETHGNFGTNGVGSGSSRSKSDQSSSSSSSSSTKVRDIPSNLKNRRKK